MFLPVSLTFKGTQKFLALAEEVPYDLRFPVGEFEPPATISPATLSAWIAEISDFPKQLSELTNGLPADQKAWRYRPGGWSIKQVVHHCADSHMNSYIRFKLALTEELPAIRPYFEDRWAELPENQADDISDSLQLLVALHRKWVVLLNALTSEQLQLQFKHPEHGTVTALDENIGIYAWHCRHHLAHVKQALRMNAPAS